MITSTLIVDKGSVKKGSNMKTSPYLEDVELKIGLTAAVYDHPNDIPVLKRRLNVIKGNIDPNNDKHMELINKVLKAENPTKMILSLKDLF